MINEMIEEFYNLIFNKLNNCNILKEKINKIYTKPHLDPEMPCIIIEFSQVKNFSNKFQNIYEINFSINVLAKDISIIAVQKICTIITDILKPSELGINNFEITGLQYFDISIVPSKDMVTTKLTINYQSLIKSKVL